MKKRTVRAAIALFLLMLTAGFPAVAGETVVVTGRIELRSIDSEDRITGISIETEDKIYEILDTPVSRQMHEIIGSDVTVTGTAGTTPEGGRSIDVKTFGKIQDTDFGKIQDTELNDN